ncbi:DUF7261 family protein [Halorarius litoreus]|uniref:DUF7261 family protein n=1 Tax=Halorarius litoreus TaxID=2962676 RepID=UPI0020CD8871|nr:hypothetical protein [Halorarius litoreus]
MAAVTERDRGQLLLIGALALAVTLVAIALVLNSAIYTHNLASRYDNPSGDTIGFTHDARVGAGGVVSYSNEEFADQGYSTIESEYIDGLAVVEQSTARNSASEGRVTEINHVTGSTVEGIWIADKEPAGSTFEPRSGGVLSGFSWTVASDVRVREYNAKVDASVLTSLSTGDAEALVDDPATAPTNAWTVEFADGTDTWRVTVYDTGSGTGLMSSKVGTTSYQSCSSSLATVVIEFAEERFGGDDCKALSFVGELDGTYTISYYYGGLVDGKYELIADRVVDDETSEVGPFTDAVDTINYGSHCGGPTYYHGTSSNWPRVSPAIYETTIETVIDSPDVTYTSQQRVAPSEPGGKPQTPRVTSFSVADGGDNDEQFEVSWAAIDPNGDTPLDVTIDVEEPDGDVETVTSTYSPPGPSSTTVTVDADTLDDPGPYVITLTVDDGNGNSRSVTQQHADDGNPTDEFIGDCVP